MNKNKTNLLAGLALCSLLFTCPKPGMAFQDGDGPDWKNPATLADAADTIDLRNFPRLPDATAEDYNVSIADLYYEAPGSADDVIEFYEEKLAGDGWKALPADSRANRGNNRVRDFTKDGFLLTLMTSPSASSRKKIAVGMTNFGNLDVRNLPRPEDSTVDYESSRSVQFKSSLSATEAMAFIRERFSKEGWTEVRNYYDADSGDKLRSQYEFIKNATCITVYPNKKRSGSELSYGCRILDFNAPIVNDAGDAVMNDDSEFELSYTSETSAKEALAFYQEHGKEFGWKENKKKSEVGDNAGQLHFSDKLTNQKIVVTILAEEAGKTKVAMSAEMKAAETSSATPADTTAEAAPQAKMDVVPNTREQDIKQLIETQKQIVENLKLVDPARAKEIEAEMQKMIDELKGTGQSNEETESNDDNGFTHKTFPVPEGAKEVSRDGDSELIKYFADLDIEAHAKFYRELLSENGWGASDPTMLDGFARLEFEFDGKSIEISLIQDDTRGGMMVTIKGDGISWE